MLLLQYLIATSKIKISQNVLFHTTKFTAGEKIRKNPGQNFNLGKISRVFCAFTYFLRFSCSTSQWSCEQPINCGRYITIHKRYLVWKVLYTAAATAFDFGFICTDFFFKYINMYPISIFWKIFSNLFLKKSSSFFFRLFS